MHIYHDYDPMDCIEAAEREKAAAEYLFEKFMYYPFILVGGDARGVVKLGAEMGRLRYPFSLLIATN